jgi:hypothetical protein
VKPLLEIREINRKLLRQTEKCEEVGAARQRLNLSAGGAKVRASSRRRTAPARQECSLSDGRCAHD